MLVWLYWKCLCLYQASTTVLLWPYSYKADSYCTCLCNCLWLIHPCLALWVRLFFTFCFGSKKSGTCGFTKSYIKLICCNQIESIDNTLQLLNTNNFPFRKWWVSVAQQIKINMQLQMSRAEKKLYLAWISHFRLLPDYRRLYQCQNHGCV